LLEDPVRRSRLIPTLSVAVLTVALGAGQGLSASAAPATRTASSPHHSPVSHALAVLHQAEAIFAPSASASPASTASPSSPSPLTATTSPSSDAASATTATQADPTMALVALAHVTHLLTGADRAAARAILARPTDANQPVQYGKWTKTEVAAGKYVCGPDVCVHWTDDPTGTNHPAATDVLDANLVTQPAPADGIPDQVDETLHELENVWAAEVTTMGYNPPKPDTRPAGLGSVDKPKIDIYLSDVGHYRLYGFCAPEQNMRKSYGYCVLDNDYRPLQFGTTNTALADLQVTAAHEFFHDIQFNYDSFEDTWFMESTAAWMEDEVYPDVNDNLQYLTDSPMHLPNQSLDLVDQSYLSSYGSWVFIRYLSDTHNADLVRTAWTDAIGKPYSIQAIDTALRAHHTTIATQFADFAAANDSPVNLYPDPTGDGALYRKYAAKPSLVVHLGTSHKSTPLLTSSPLKHLSSIRLGAEPASAHGHLKVQIIGPSRLTAPAARLVIHRVGGGATMQRIKLVRGAAVVTKIPFNRAAIVRVDVIMINASTGYTCNRGTSLACHGTPTYNRSVFRIKLTHTI
jgi:hypothetical protein